MDLVPIISKLLNDNWTLEHTFFGTKDNPDPNNKTRWVMIIVENKTKTNNCISTKLQNILNICFPVEGEIDTIDTFSEIGGKIIIHENQLDLFLDKLYDFVENRQLVINAL